MDTQLQHKNEAANAGRSKTPEPDASKSSGPLQFRSRALQQRSLSSGDVIVSADLSGANAVSQIQSMLGRAPIQGIAGIGLADCGAAALIRLYVDTFANTKQAFMDTGWLNSGILGASDQIRITMTPNITNEVPRAAQNAGATTNVGQTSGGSMGQSGSTTVTGTAGVSGEASGEGAKVGGTASGSVATANTNTSTGSGSSTAGGGFGTIMADCTVAFSVTIETKPQGLAGFGTSVANFFGAGIQESWSTSGSVVGGTAILRKPDPNAPR